MASRYYSCNCLNVKKQNIFTVVHKCSDYIIHQNKIFISNELADVSTTTANNMYLFTISDSYLKQTFIVVESSTSGGQISVQPSYYSSRALHTCGVYQPLQMDILKKYDLGVGHKETDILDIRKLPASISEQHLLSSLNATKSYHFSIRVPQQEDPSKTVCSTNSPCCSVNKITLPQANIDGLACKTNNTLNFFLLDAVRYKLMLKNINIDLVEGSSALLVVDLPMKRHFVMPESMEITEDSIGKQFVEIFLNK